MANKRKALSPKIRYEVLKRDKFTCQYCGRSAPDVLLQIDHIKPVAKGGDNDIMNLITSCRECNIGKGAREISDDSVVKKQQRQLQELAERKEQLEMMLKWREELQLFEEDKVDKINKYIGTYSDWTANDNGKKTIKKWLKEFPFELILEAIDISFSKYYDGTDRSWDVAFNKVGGICSNKVYDEKHGNKRYYYNYLAKSCRSKYGYWKADDVHYYVDNYLMDEDDFERAKSVLNRSRIWEDFKEAMDEEFEM